MGRKKDSRLTRAGVSGYNKPKRTPNHPKKSHVVVAKVGDKVRLYVLVNKALVVLVKLLKQLHRKLEEKVLKQDTLRI